MSTTRCPKCGAPLVAGAPPPPPAVSPLSRKAVALLAWRATKFIARWGFNAAVKGARASVERAQHHGDAPDPRTETIEGDYTLREWRAWTKPVEPTESERAERITWGRSTAVKGDKRR